MKNILIGLALVTVAVLVVVFLPSSPSDTNNNVAHAQATVYKSPTCGCCVKYVAYLEENNYDVKVVTTKNMQAIKTKYNIPEDMPVSYTHLRAHETDSYLVCRLLLEK